MKRGPFTADEDSTILAQHAIHGNKWAVISRSMPGRTDNQVKNRFNSTLRRLIANNGKEGADRRSESSAVIAPSSPKGKVPSRPQSRAAERAELAATGSNGSASTPSRSKRERSPGESTSAPSLGACAGESSPKRSRSGGERSAKVVDKRSSGTEPAARKTGESERQGLDNLIQASLQELERLKKQKGEIFEWGAMPYGAARDCGTPEPTRSEDDGVVPSLLAPKPKRGGFSVSVPSDMYDWRSHSPALSAPFLAGLKRVDSLASLKEDGPSRPSSALSVPMSLQASSMLHSDGWYARMLDNLGTRKAATDTIAEVKTEGAEIKA